MRRHRYNFWEFRFKGKKGFTLIELLIVIAIIGILSAIAIPTYLTYVNHAKDAEAHSNLGSIFTDETAFTSTNSAYISAGESSGPITPPATGAVSPIHSFYSATNTTGTGTYNIDLGPYSCSAKGVLTAVGGYNAYTKGAATPTAGPTTPAMGGFGDIGFLPVGRLYFYYGVAINSTASLSGPTAVTSPTWPLAYAATSVKGGAVVGTANVNGSCGGGFEAFAGSNFTGGNLQIYAVDDYTRTATLITGAAF
jgi:prepilin-type N-terminal cleavage/methylation domain-containing protein